MLGEIKTACGPDHVEQVRGWLEEARQVARNRLLDVAAEQAAPTLVLPVDQAEELFSADAGDEAPGFLELLASLVHHEVVTPAVIVALTIRADRYEPLQIAPQLAEVKTAPFDDLKPLSPAGYHEVITGPARRASAAGPRTTIEPALVERLLADTAQGADALPLLALKLQRLYRDFGADGHLKLADYELMGGMAHVVETEVNELLASNPTERRAQLDILHDAFIPWLATINPDNDQPMRRVARWADLAEPSRPLIDGLVARRLMVKDIRNDEVVVEVALESLLRQWDELAGWLREQARDLKDAERLERVATDWRANDRNKYWLLPGTRLAEAEKLAAKPLFRDRLNPIRDYLDASRVRENLRIETKLQAVHAESQSDAVRRFLALTALVVAVALLVVGLAPVTAMGLLLIGIAVPTLIFRLLPRSVAWIGLAISLVCVLDGVLFEWNDLERWEIRVIGPTWLIVAAALMSMRDVTTWLVSRVTSRTGAAT